MRTLSIVLCVVLISVGLILRSVEVLNRNYVFGFDQGLEYLMVKKIVVDHKLTLVGAESGGGYSGFQGIFHGPGYQYLLTIPFVLFHGDPYGAMVFIYLLGIGTVILGYFIGGKIFGYWGGFVMSTLLALSPALISQSRMIWMPNVAPFFILIALWSIYRLDTSKNISIILSSFLCSFLYNFGLTIAIPMCLTLGFYIIVVRKFRHIMQYGSFILGSVLGFSPFIIFEFRHGFMAVRSVIVLLFKASVSTQTLSPEILVTPKTFLYNFATTFPHQTFVPDIFVMLITIALVIFFAISEKDRKIENIIWYTILVVIISFLLDMMLGIPVYPHYLIVLHIVYIFWLTYLAIVIFHTHRNLASKLLPLILLVALLFVVPSGIHDFRKDYIDYGGGAKIRGKLDVIDYIYNDARGKPFGLYIFTPPVYTYAYDYLFWWYAEKKYHFVPKAEKSGIFYLLIEPDWEKPWSYKGWLETVIKTGTIIETKELPSGLIIQKRKAEGYETN